jgi:hypothetical protein
MRFRHIALLTLVVTAAAGCGPGAGTYCQSGPKYGTRCYAEPDVRRGPGAGEAPDHTDGTENTGWR